ncbi:acyltransferase family protein [Hymenobacter elongatus]|uniref:Acyltransferase n=1 Tax=Hymenobacter elongatus TaxID=877208 RepID=A0A4Z0PR13_9BACT|nr:acyltransferase [Hymenobacter elongatus]TGE18663.1 acyltransferase [Hymenobacter elongatus]
MSQPLPNSLPAQRIDYLDSVRGLAAFAVVIYHFTGWRWNETLEFKLGAMVFNGSDAVSLFFVLSGLVLSWKYFQPNESIVIDAAHYRQYVINRVVRLYVPFLAALAVYYLYGHRHDALGQLVSDFSLNTHHWLEEALLIRGKHDMYTPAWTLEVEMAASLFMPFLVLLLRQSRQLFLLLLAVCAVLGSGMIFWGIIHFCLGMLLTYYFRQLATADARRAAWYRYRYVLYLVVLAMFSSRHITRIYPLGEGVNYILGLLRIDLFHLTGVAAAFMLAYIINSPRLQRWLATGPLLFLGRISYSVYLLHWFVVVYIMDHWDKLAAPFTTSAVAFWVLLGAAVAATLVLATIFNILVERPSIRLGKRLSTRFAPAPAVPQPVA